MFLTDINYIKNSPILYIMGTIISLFVIAQSLFFLIRAYRHGKQIGVEKKKMNKAIISSIVFSIIPSIAILVGLISLSDALGKPLPWIRLSVIGALTYELPAAIAAAIPFAPQGVANVLDFINTPEAFSSVVIVMTLGIIPGLILVPLFLKKILKGYSKLKKGDSAWGPIFQSALFIGMICAFSGMIVGSGWGSIIVLITSMIIMAICGYFIKVKKMAWLESYAIPISMLGSMLLTILYAHLWPNLYTISEAIETLLISIL